MQPAPMYSDHYKPAVLFSDAYSYIHHYLSVILKSKDVVAKKT